MTTLNQDTIVALAKYLDDAQREARDVIKITDDYPDMDWEDAYAIQFEVQQRKERRGIRAIGLKAGLTSYAKMLQMGVDSPVFGYLTEDFWVPESTRIDTSTLIHPKVEPEIAFMLKSSLKGPGCHIADVLAATDFIMPAIEVIDSRYKDFKFDLKSVIADNTSFARFVLGGSMLDVKGLDMRTLGVVLEKNGEMVACGAGAAVLGHPASSVAALANHLGEQGKEIPAGTVILSGGITEAIAVKAGDSVTLRAQGLGSVSVGFK